MENSSNSFAEEMAYTTFSDYQVSEFTAAHVDLAGPGDEDEEEEAGNDDNPPLEDDVVHSPVPTQTGGKPNQT